MAGFDLWTPEFCLGCDRQTDGAAYCSESCKLAEFEKTGSAASSPASSSPSSPSVYGAPAHPWSSSTTSAAAASCSYRAPASPSAGFHLAPAYDFSRSSSSSHRAALSSLSSSLTPSSSYSSLCSMQTASSATQSPTNSDLSERSRKELRDYAMSFEHARLQRRRSY